MSCFDLLLAVIYIFVDPNIHAVLQARKLSMRIYIEWDTDANSLQPKGLLGHAHGGEKLKTLLKLFLLLLLSSWSASLKGRLIIVLSHFDQIDYQTFLSKTTLLSLFFFSIFSAWNCFSLQELSLACQPETLKVIKNISSVKTQLNVGWNQCLFKSVTADQ